LAYTVSSWTFAAGNFLQLLPAIEENCKQLNTFQKQPLLPSQDFRNLFPAQNFTVFSKIYLPSLFELMHPGTKQDHLWHFFKFPGAHTELPSWTKLCVRMSKEEQGK